MSRGAAILGLFAFLWKMGALEPELVTTASNNVTCPNKLVTLHCHGQSALFWLKNNDVLDDQNSDYFISDHHQDTTLTLNATDEGVLKDIRCSDGTTGTGINISISKVLPSVFDVKYEVIYSSQSQAVVNIFWKYNLTLTKSHFILIIDGQILTDTYNSSYLTVLNLGNTFQLQIIPMDHCNSGIPVNRTIHIPIRPTCAVPTPPEGKFADNGRCPSETFAIVAVVLLVILFIEVHGYFFIILRGIGRHVIPCVHYDPKEELKRVIATMEPVVNRCKRENDTFREYIDMITKGITGIKATSNVGENLK